MTSTYKLIFHVHKGDQNHAADLLQEVLDATAVSMEETFEGSDTWIIQGYFPEIPERERVINILDILPNTTRQKTESFTVEEVPDEDWVSRVQKNLAPVHAGNVVIHGSHDSARFRGKKLAVEIDAGQAFGTAHHGTTRGCVLALQRVLKRKQFRNVLDLGTGSGILAITTAKLQRCSQITASDNDLISTIVAEENCFKNNVGNLVKVVHAEGFNHSHLGRITPFDLIVANILAGPLIDMSHQLSRAITPGGYIILSGLLVSQTRSVTAAYLDSGFVKEWSFPLEGWNTLVMRKAITG